MFRDSGLLEEYILAYWYYRFHYARILMQYLSRRPGVLAGIGAILATGAYIVTRQMLGLKPLKKRKRMPRPHGRPLRKRAA